MIYRYMDEIYLNDFIENGNIRLGSLAKYKDIENKSRKDDTEGSIFWYSNGEFILTGEPPRLLMMCFSLDKSEKIATEFKTRVGFCLNEDNIDTFVKEIGKKINTSIALSGRCDYICDSLFPQINGLSFDTPKKVSNRKVIIYPYSDIILEKNGKTEKMYNLNDKTIHFLNNYSYYDEKKQNNLREEIIQSVFIKRDFFKFHNEFRIVWLINEEVMEKNIFSLCLSNICKKFEVE